MELCVRMHLPSLDRHPINSTAKQTGFRSPRYRLNAKTVVLIGNHNGNTTRVLKGNLKLCIHELTHHIIAILPMNSYKK